MSKFKVRPDCSIRRSADWNILVYKKCTQIRFYNNLDLRSEKIHYIGIFTMDSPLTA
jgi:hypothetical protein